MDTATVNQAYIFLLTVLGGMIIGFVFDIFRIFRKLKKSGFFSVFVQDILFFIIFAVLMFAIIFYANDGEVRWYEFLGIFLGAVFYFVIFSSYIIKFLVTLIKIFGKITKFIFKIVAFPFFIIYNVTKKPIGFIVISIRAIIKKANKLFFSFINSFYYAFKKINLISKKN